MRYFYIYFIQLAKDIKMKTKQKHEVWGAQKAQKSTITGRCSAPNSAELNK